MVRLDTLVAVILQDARQRMDEGKTGGAMNPAGKVATDLSEAKRSRGRKPGFEGRVAHPLDLQQHGRPARVTGRPGGQRLKL